MKVFSGGLTMWREWNDRIAETVYVRDEQLVGQGRGGTIPRRTP